MTTRATGAAPRWPRPLPRGAASPSVIALTDDARGGDPLRLPAALPPGSLVIFRHYGAPDRAALARRLARACRQHGIFLARACRPQDGLRPALARRGAWHLSAPWLKRHPVRARRRPGRRLSAAVHGLPELFRAKRAGVRLVLVSPVFATASHPGRRPLGAVRFAALCRAARRQGMAVYALGGLGPGRVARARVAGAAGIAGVSAFAPSLDRGAKEAEKKPLGGRVPAGG